LFVKYRCPTIAAVYRFPNAAGGRSGVVGARISWHAGNSCNAISDLGADKTKSHLILVLDVRLLCIRGDDASHGKDPGKKELPAAAKHDGNLLLISNFYMA
jgi:hypothetical protein